jgi:5-methylcytosine-specific restriction protein B
MEQLEELKARYDRDPDGFARRTGDDATLEEFQKSFPANGLKSLSLEDYCMGSGSRPKSFSWWLERGLQPVIGRYMPGTARGHLIYREKDGSHYKNQRLVDLSDQDALNYVLALTSGIALLNSLEDGRKFDPPGAIFKALNLEPRTEMGEARRLRIFSAYHPDQIVPINSPIHISHFLGILGTPANQIEAGIFCKAMQLWDVYLKAKEAMPRLTPYGLMRLLYDKELGLAPASSFATSEEMSSDESSESDRARNVILYGPPGTGKTYTSIDYAVQILDPRGYKAVAKDRTKLLAAFNKARAEGRVAFVTFHQSFSYEEFVEGLKADVDASGQIAYRPADGIFKKMCDVAASRQVQHTDKTLDPRGRTIWKMSLGNAQLDDRFDECIQQGVAALGFGEDLDFTGVKNRDDIKNRFRTKGIEPPPFDFAVTALELFITVMKEGDLIVVSEGNHKFRAIGQVTGPYLFSASDEIGNFHHLRKVDWLRIYSPSLPVDAVLTKVFSQMTIYKLSEPSLDMPKLVALLSQAAPTPRLFSKGEKIASYTVEEVGEENLTVRKAKSGGTLPIAWSIVEELASYVRAGQITVQDIREGQVFAKVDSKLEKNIVNGYANLLAPMVEKMVSGSTAANKQGSQTRVLIIDEINRGNVSKVFGELITLIEDNKRAGQPEALSVTLPYSRESFSVPSNLFLVGTMNTADRSLTGLDIALRRRFQMVNVPPDPSLLKGIVVEGVDVSRVLTAMNQRLELMLGADLLIGHSYFLTLKSEASLGALKKIFMTAIMPLLQEYFFEDGAKIHRVLADQWKQPANQIVSRQMDENQIRDLLGDEWTVSGGSGWRVNEQALEEPESYRGIYERLNA